MIPIVSLLLLFVSMTSLAKDSYLYSLETITESEIEFLQEAEEAKIEVSISVFQDLLAVSLKPDIATSRAATEEEDSTGNSSQSFSYGLDLQPIGEVGTFSYEKFLNGADEDSSEKFSFAFHFFDLTATASFESEERGERETTTLSEISISGETKWNGEIEASFSKQEFSIDWELPLEGDIFLKQELGLASENIDLDPIEISFAFALGTRLKR